MDDAELAALQAALIDALGRASSPAEVLTMLEAASLPEWAHRWLAGSDARALETAIELVARWTESEGRE